MTITPTLTLSTITLIGALFGLVGYLYIQVKRGGIEGAKESNEILRSLNTDLKTAMAEQAARHTTETALMRSTHDKEMMSLQTQITALQTQIRSLEQTNQVLQNTVTSKENILELQRTVDKFTPYLAILDNFVINDKKVNEKLDTLLSIQQSANLVERRKGQHDV